MQDETKMMREIIGRTITDIRCNYGTEEGWLDTADCSIEIDNSFFIEIPYKLAHEVLLVAADPEAKTIFSNLSDIPHYHVNKGKKSIAATAAANKKRERNIFNRIAKFLFGYSPGFKEYKPYKIEFHENKLKYIIKRKIVDYWWLSEEFEKGFFELDNGYFITDKYIAPQGTGLAGFHYYTSFESLTKRHGEKLCRYSTEMKDNS